MLRRSHCCRRPQNVGSGATRAGTRRPVEGEGGQRESKSDDDDDDDGGGGDDDDDDDRVL